jgi:hypothetical protein
MLTKKNVLLVLFRKKLYTEREICFMAIMANAKDERK